MTFLPGKRQKTLNVSLIDTQMDSIELSAIVDGNNDTVTTLAQTVLTVQETDGKF